MSTTPRYGETSAQEAYNARASEYGSKYKRSILIAKDNGTTGFGLVKAGTPLGKITASGKYRPCAKKRVSVANAVAAATIKVADASAFYVGDVVDVISTAGVAGAATLDGDGAAGADIDLESATIDGLAHTVQIIDPGTDAALGHSVTVNPSTGVATIVVILEYSSAAIQSTVAEVIAELQSADIARFVKASSGGGTTSNTAAAVAATPLAGGLAPGAVIANNATVSAVDKAASPNTVTIGSSILTAVGDVIQNTDGSETAELICDRTVNTFDGYLSEQNGTPTYADQGSVGGFVGLFKVADMPGYDAEMASDLGATLIGDYLKL